MKNYQYYLKKGAASEQFSMNERIAIAGNCATEALSQVIKGYFADHQIGLDVIDLGYDSASLSVLDDESPLYKDPVRFLLLYYSPLKLREKFYQSENKEHFADSFEEELQAIIAKLKAKNISALITSLPTALESHFGNASAIFPQSLIHQLQKINFSIKKIVIANGHCHLLDIEHLANRIGLDQFHSDKLWAMGKYPCHTNYFPDVAASLFRVYRALKGHLKKVIVFDLDNTVWGGMIGEDGVTGIALGASVEGEAYKSFQYYLKSLKESGYLLAVCSKNDYENAILPFKKHPEMVLKEEDITLFIANWEPKSSSIRAMSETLNLGLDSFVLIDDSAFERNEVRAALPEVSVPELNDDPSGYISQLDKAFLFESITFTDSDRDRTEQYRQEARRQTVKNTSANIDEYLKSLEMTCLVENINLMNSERASQLILRSNQFNLRTQRFSRAQLESMANDPRFVTLCFSLSDKFGNYGLISVLVGERVGKKLFIRELVMSCRVLKRGMESFIFNKLMILAQSSDIEIVKGDYVPTGKNKLVQNLLSEHGFAMNSTNKAFPFEQSPASYKPSANFIREKAHE